MNFKWHNTKALFKHSQNHNNTTKKIIFREGTFPPLIQYFPSQTTLVMDLVTTLNLYLKTASQDISDGISNPSQVATENVCRNTL
jgi:hypothetical protein